MSLFLDETGEPAAQQRDSSRLKIKTRLFVDQQLTHRIMILSNHFKTCLKPTSHPHLNREPDLPFLKDNAFMDEIKDM